MKLGEQVVFFILVPDQDKLLLELAVRVLLGSDLIEQQQQLLERLVLGRHDEADHMHQLVFFFFPGVDEQRASLSFGYQVRQRLAVVHEGEDLFHGRDPVAVLGVIIVAASMRGKEASQEKKPHTKERKKKKSSCRYRCSSSPFSSWVRRSCTDVLSVESSDANKV